MNNSSIYGEHYEELETVRKSLVGSIDQIRERLNKENGIDPIEHCLSRIKSDASMREKCHRKGLPETTESALEKIFDAIGIRIVCAFVSDVYAIRNSLAELPDCEIVEEKDYIRHSKPNGYRSYHMIVRYQKKTYAEIQLRTISMDTWAALEHHLKYKQNIGGNVRLIEEELKRCADELASTDISMQTIRDMIFEERSE